MESFGTSSYLVLHTAVCMCERERERERECVCVRVRVCVGYQGTYPRMLAAFLLLLSVGTPLCPYAIVYRWEVEIEFIREKLA